MTAYLLGALLFIIAMVIFVMQNTAPVIVHFITWTSPEISIALVALIAACAGSLVTFLVDSYRAFKTGQKMKAYLKENKKYKKEIESLIAKIANAKPKKTDSAQEEKTDQTLRDE